MSATSLLQVQRAVTPAGLIAPAALLIESGVITAVGSPASIGAPDGVTVLRRETLTALPGLIDVQINGAAGRQFGDGPGTLRTAAEHLLSTGCTAICPTLPSRAAERYPDALADLADPAGTVRNLGVHLEGPFLSPARAGAHDPGVLVDPDLDWAERLLDTSPVPVALWTVAPERPGGLDLVRRLAARDVVVAAGHSDATYVELRAAVDAGVRMVTHLFNAQRGIDHREPGVPGAFLDDERLLAGLILDGEHVHPAVAGHVLRSVPERLVLVTDAVAAAGMPPGILRFGEYEIDTTRGAPRLPDGTLAGSTLTMIQALRVAAAEIGLVAATRMAATRPADLLARRELGRLAAGATADFILLDERLEVAETWVGGAPCWSRS